MFLIMSTDTTIQVEAEEIPDFEVECAENEEEQCLCVLVLDTSGSMNSATKEGKAIDALNRGLQSFHKDIMRDATLRQTVELSIVTFNHETECVQEPQHVFNFSMPHLTAKGKTRLVSGMKKGISVLKSRMRYYKRKQLSVTRPFLILISDGKPDESDNEIQHLANELKRLGKGAEFVAIGVEGASFSVLEKLSYDKPAYKLKGLKFHEFFDWLSHTMSAVTNSGMNGSWGDAQEIENNEKFEEALDLDWRSKLGSMSHKIEDYDYED